MKLLISLLATAGLTGCVGYGYPYGGAGYYTQGAYYGQGAYAQPYVVDPSITIYSAPQYRAAPNHYHGRGDRDRDGIPNRVDRDRDGDGVPNSVDRRPMDPRRI